MSNNQAEYSVYQHIENVKNSLYRQLSAARNPSLFWPRFYYSWFFAPEKTMYNLLSNRQRLGQAIHDDEVNEYNRLRQEIKPSSHYNLVKYTRRTEDSVKYDDVKLERRNQIWKYCLAGGLFATFYLQLTRVWLIAAFLPVGLRKYYDYKFAPIEEIDNFYKYVIQRRSANNLYNENKKVTDEFAKAENYKVIERELTRSNKTLLEAVASLDRAYLDAALSEVEASKQ